MKKFISSICILFTFYAKTFAQVPDSTQTPVNVTPNVMTTDTTDEDDETEFNSTDEREKLPNWYYSVSLDGTASSGNVNRQLLNFKTTLNYENPKSIFGFFTSPRFQYGTNSDILQEREINLDINSTLFYSQHDVYGLLFGAFEQSNLRKISSRFNIGVGIGWRIFGGRNSSKARFKLSVSNALVREITDFIVKQDRNIYRNSTRFKLKYDIIPNKFSIQSVVFLQPSLIDDYYRWNSSTQLSYSVGKYISILASFENTYENFNTSGIQNAQTNTTIGLIYSGSK
jgi:putative salt-induced outer membrane protein YdiY